MSERVPWFSAEAALGYTLGTGRLFCDVATFHEWTERLIGRPVWTHEFGDEQVWQQLREEFERVATEAANSQEGTSA